MRNNYEFEFEGNRIKVEIFKIIKEATLFFRLEQKNPKQVFWDWVRFDYEDSAKHVVEILEHYVYFEIYGKCDGYFDSIAVTRCVENNWFEQVVSGSLMTDLLKAIESGNDTAIKNVCLKIEGV